MSHTTFYAAGTADREAMLNAVGVTSMDDLFAHIPAELQTDQFDTAPGMSELEMMQRLRSLASRNSGDLINFCGAGFYDHFIPAAVDRLAGRGEFYTAYTPYQPEVAQGTLQAMYEYQTAITRLTGMETANASLYDGGTALFEGMMMALRITRRKRVLVDEGVNPIYRTMLRSYTRNLSIDYEELPTAGGIADRQHFSESINDTTAAIILQNPNFFGCVDDLADLCQTAHHAGALAVLSVYPTALGLLKTPGEMEADIVTGEGQSLGNPLSFGGPYLGFMATRSTYVRKMPGRVVGMTHDAEGRRGFVLTLQTREQHIRREKATSNICTNQGLCALRAVIYLALMGRRGFVDVARQCACKAAYAFEQLTAIDGIEPAFVQPFFNEFTLRIERDASDVVSALIDRGVAAGFPLSRYYHEMSGALLLAFTEKRTHEEIDILAAKLKHLLRA